jgi:lysozyme
MNAFIIKIKDGAIAAQKKYSILASLTIAQAILETGWGKSSIGNNIFGIKASPSWTGKTVTCKTGEYVNGKYVTVMAEFRDYDSIADSIIDHALLFVNNKSRYGNIIGCTDYKTACQNVQKDGYATSPTYAKTLISIIETNKLTQFDTPTVQPVKPKVFVMRKGATIKYTGRVYATSTGTGAGKTMSGTFKVDNYLPKRPYGTHIPAGWVKPSDCKVIG